MYSTKEVLEIIERGIANIDMPEEPNRLYNPIGYTMQEGGKRLRPLLMLLTANLYTDNIEPYVSAALGVEMFHNFTLLHDDIMDNSPTRRGRESVHTKWGHNVAILSGDAMLIFAYKLILATPSEHLHKVLSIFNKLSLELCEGQQLDMDFEERNEVSMQEYMDMIELKTSVLIAGAMEMGGVLGGASDCDTNLIYNFGLNIGLAFQIQDDILDMYADSVSFGKPIGGDIIEGKKSFISLLCMEMAADEDKARLLDILHDSKGEDSVRVSEARAIFDKYDIKNIAEEVVKSYFDDAMAIMDAVEVSPERKEVVINYVQSLLYRSK